MSAASKSLRLLINGGDNMLGRAVNLSCYHRVFGDDHIMDSMPSAYYLKVSLHPSETDKDRTLSEIRELNRQGRYVWGDYLGMKIDPPPQVRLLNLETSVVNKINNNDIPIWKGINYQLAIENFRELIHSFAQEKHGGERSIPYIISFSNNHIMDFGRKAFDSETLPSMKKILSDEGYGKMTGAGGNFSEASEPAKVTVEDRNEIRVFAMATECSGTPRDWEATSSTSGLICLPPLIDTETVNRAFEIAKRVLTKSTQTLSNKTLINIVSIHWGPNWAYRSLEDDGQVYRRRFAHLLIDELNVDLIYGHSSHHVRGIEQYSGKLILYGAGDLINDYEGFTNPGDERFCKMGSIFIVDLFESNGNLKALYVVPMFMNRLKLCRWSKESLIWDPLDRRMKQNPMALIQFKDFLNILSRKDGGENGLSSRLVESDEAIPGGPVLVYP